MTPYVLGGFAVLGLVLFVFGVFIVRVALSPDAAGFGLFAILVAAVVWLLDLLALGLWVWLG